MLSTRYMQTKDLFSHLGPLPCADLEFQVPYISKLMIVTAVQYCHRPRKQCDGSSYPELVTNAL
jgi:hypothetical protein